MLNLNFNENNLGISPLVREAVIKALDSAHQYPLPFYDELKQELAAFLGTSNDEIIYGAGSGAIIDAALLRFKLEHKSPVVLTCAPTFEAALWIGPAYNLPYHALALKSDFHFDLDALKQRAKELKAAGHDVLIYLASPNNPTGLVINGLNAWLLDMQKDFLGELSFIVDEAYFEFSPQQESALPLIKSMPNLLVTRTFSKAYAMAGLRVGYAAASKELASSIQARVDAVGLSTIALKAALAAMKDEEFLALTLSEVAAGKALIEQCFDDLGVDYLKSSANFIFHKIPGENRANAHEYYSDFMLQKHGLRLSRLFDGNERYSRVSISKLDEAKTFVLAFKDFYKGL